MCKWVQLKNVPLYVFLNSAVFCKHLIVSYLLRELLIPFMLFNSNVYIQGMVYVPEDYLDIFEVIAYY